MPHPPIGYKDHDNARRLEVLFRSGPLRRGEASKEEIEKIASFLQTRKAQYKAAKGLESLVQFAGLSGGVAYLEEQVVAKLGSKARFTEKEKKKAFVLLGRFMRDWKPHLDRGEPEYSDDDYEPTSDSEDSGESSSSGVSENDGKENPHGPFDSAESGESGDDNGFSSHSQDDQE